ncbi:MAG: hypothetical protein NUV61_00855 [Candidatus Azambacteria bacterium]|nr:hypothetical protein [Candidatus Azambacteria bacterium]
MVSEAKRREIKTSFEPQKTCILLSCEQVDAVLVHIANVHSPKDLHEPEWESVVEYHIHDFACGKCGSCYRDEVLKAAQGIGVL